MAVIWIPTVDDETLAHEEQQAEEEFRQQQGEMLDLIPCYLCGGEGDNHDTNCPEAPDDYYCPDWMEDA